MKNKITDLNNHLFAALERLGDEGIPEDQLKQEIARSKAIANVASKIIDSNRVVLEAAKLMEKAGVDITTTDNMQLLLPTKSM